VIVQKTRKNHKKNKKTKKKIMSGKEMYERNPFSSSFLVPSGKRKRMQRKRLFGEHHFTQSSTYPQTVKWHVLFSLNEEKQKKKTLISTACLRPFQKAMCFGAHPPQRGISVSVIVQKK